MSTGGTSNPRLGRFVSRGIYDAPPALTGTLTLTKKSGQYQRVDPDGAPRDVILPAVTRQDHDDWFKIANAAAAANALTIKDALGSTIATAPQGKLAHVHVDTDGAWQLFGILDYTPA